MKDQIAPSNNCENPIPINGIFFLDSNLATIVFDNKYYILIFKEREIIIREVSLNEYAREIRQRNLHIDNNIQIPPEEIDGPLFKNLINYLKIQYKLYRLQDWIYTFLDPSNEKTLDERYVAAGCLEETIGQYHEAKSMAIHMLKSFIPPEGWSIDLDNINSNGLRLFHEKIIRLREKIARMYPHLKNPEPSQDDGGKTICTKSSEEAFPLLIAVLEQVQNDWKLNSETGPIERNNKK